MSFVVIVSFSLGIQDEKCHDNQKEKRGEWESLANSEVRRMNKKMKKNTILDHKFPCWVVPSKRYANWFGIPNGSVAVTSFWGDNDIENFRPVNSEEHYLFDNCCTPMCFQFFVCYENASAQPRPDQNRNWVGQIRCSAPAF